MRAMTVWKPWSRGQRRPARRAGARPTPLPRWSRAHVDRVLDGGGVGGPVAERRQRGEARRPRRRRSATSTAWAPERACSHAVCSSSVRGTRSKVDRRGRDLEVVDLADAPRRRRGRASRSLHARATLTPRRGAGSTGDGRPVGCDGAMRRRRRVGVGVAAPARRRRSSPVRASSRAHDGDVLVLGEEDRSAGAPTAFTSSSSSSGFIRRVDARRTASSSSSGKLSPPAPSDCSVGEPLRAARGPARPAARPRPAS